MNKDLFLYNQQKQKEFLEKIKTKSFSEIVEESKNEIFKIKNPYMNIIDKNTIFEKQKNTIQKNKK